MTIVLPAGLDEQRELGPDWRAWLDGLDDTARAISSTLLFSAKEAWFKCWSRGGDSPSFTDIRVTPRDDGFSVAQSGVGEAEGPYCVTDTMVVTAICVPVRSAV